MPYTIDRQSLFAGPFTLTSDPATSAKISLSSFAGALLFVESVTGAASQITWHAAKDFKATQTYPVRSAISNNVLTGIEQGYAYAFPDEVFGAQFVVPVLDSDTAIVSVTLKG